MITIEEISERLKDKKDYDFNATKESFMPITTSDYVVPIFHIKESSANGAELRLIDKLSKVLAFIDSVKHRRSSTECTIMSISVTSKTNLQIWGSRHNVSNAIAFMKEIGLISTESEKYQFNSLYAKDNISKTYRYYKENEDKVKEYCEERGIEKYEVKNTVYSDFELDSIHTDIDRAKVRFCSKLKLVKPKDMSQTAFEKELTLCLYQNYPGLKIHIEKANEINEKYYKDYPEFRIRFQPKFTWSKDGTYVKGIGIRATSSLNNVKKEERPKILQKYGFTLEKDVKSSVPRITLSLNLGHWIDESIDIYEKIYHKMEPDGIFTDSKREAIKKLHMRAYFDGTVKQLGHHTWLNMEQTGIAREDVCEKMEDLRNAIVKAEGGRLYGNEVFYVESCVYLMTLYDLLSQGFRVWLVYDCFYASAPDTETEEFFEERVLHDVRQNFESFLKMYWR